MMCYNLQFHHHHLHLLRGTLPKILDQWRSFIFDRFMFNMVKGHYLQLRCQPTLFHNIKWFNIKAAMSHHPII